MYVPIILPLILALGFDSITACAIALCGSAAGFTAALANPFTVGIGQKIAGLPLYSGWQFRLAVFILMTSVAIIYVMRYARSIQKDPERSQMYEQDQRTRNDLEIHDEPKVSVRQTLAGLTALGLFILMVYGVFNWSWDMPQIGAIFISIGIFSGLVAGMKGNQICEAFYEGYNNVLLGTLIVGIARGVGVVMTTDRKSVV